VISLNVDDIYLRKFGEGTRRKILMYTQLISNDTLHTETLNIKFRSKGTSLHHNEIQIKFP